MDAKKHEIDFDEQPQKRAKTDAKKHEIDSDEEPEKRAKTDAKKLEIDSDEEPELNVYDVTTDEEEVTTDDEEDKEAYKKMQRDKVHNYSELFNDRMRPENIAFHDLPPELRHMILRYSRDVVTKRRWFDKSPLYKFYENYTKSMRADFNALVKCLNSTDLVEDWLTNRINRRVPDATYDSFHAFMTRVILGGFVETPLNVVVNNTQRLLVALINCKDNRGHKKGITHIVANYEDVPESLPEGETTILAYNKITFWSVQMNSLPPGGTMALKLQFADNFITLTVGNSDGWTDMKDEEIVRFADKEATGGPIAHCIETIQSKYGIKYTNTGAVSEAETEAQETDLSKILQREKQENAEYRDVIQILFTLQDNLINVTYHPTLSDFCTKLATFLCFADLPFKTKRKYGGSQENNIVYFASFVDRGLRE
jgi:hypothetical protein